MSETKAKTGQNLTQNCSKRNLTYQTCCNSCEEKDEKGKSEEEKEKTRLYTYVGKTAKSAQERGGEHRYEDVFKVLQKFFKPTLDERG